ncbi:MAG: MarR family winged helix-turn-helix transcriptional regulator [Methylovirgula sp.]
MSDTPEICSCSALRQAARHATRLYDSALSPIGIGLNQYSILAKLDRFGPKSLQQLADLLVMDRSTLGHLLRPLEARGLISMQAAPKDKRQRVICLAPEGIALMQRAKPLWAKAEAQFEHQFGAAEAEGLRRLLKDVTRVAFDIPTAA